MLQISDFGSTIKLLKTKTRIPLIYFRGFFISQNPTNPTPIKKGVKPNESNTYKKGSELNELNT